MIAIGQRRAAPGGPARARWRWGEPAARGRGGRAAAARPPTAARPRTQVIVLAADAARALADARRGTRRRERRADPVRHALARARRDASSLRGACTTPSIYVDRRPPAWAAARSRSSRRFGTVTPIAAAGPGRSRPGAPRNAIAVARFTDGTVRLGRPRTGSRARVRQRRPPARRARRGAAVGHRRLRAAAAARSARPDPGSRWRAISATSSPPTPARRSSSRCAASTITAG